MSFDPTGESLQSKHLTLRRQFLAAAAGVALGTVAGCSGVTTQEFEATPVVLSEDAREELVLAETSRDSSTISRTVEEIDGEVTITNQFAAYSRGGFVAHPDDQSFQPSLIERFLSRVNGTEGAGPVVVVSGSELESGEGLMDFIGQNYLESLTADQISLAVPAGVRSASETDSEAIAPLVGPLLLGWMTDNAIPEELTSGSDSPRTYIVDAKEFFPGLVYDRGRKYNPIKEWMPAGYTGADDLIDEGKVLIVLDSVLTPEEMFGVAPEEMPGERLEESGAEQPFNPFLIAVPASVAFDDQSPVAERYKNFFNVGTPVWAGGATYGIGVLSTPAAEVAGQSVNPLAHLGLKEILTSEQVRQVPMDNSAFNEGIEWLSGPDLIGSIDAAYGQSDSPDGTTILNQESELKSFLGVVSGENGPWGVDVHMGRVEHDGDVVVAAGTHYWPVGSSKYFQNRTGQRFTGILGSIITEARTLTDAAGKRFEPIPNVDT